MIHFIHGIHVNDPYQSVGTLEPYFNMKGFGTKVHNYGYAWATGTRFSNPKRAKILGSFVNPNDIIVGHSNGATLAWMIANQQPIRGIVLINPALDDDAKFDKQLEFIDVYYNHTDSAVPWASLLQFNHPWGDMGHEGYTGMDNRVTNIDCCNGYGAMLPCVDGHSAIFHGQNLEPWANFMVNRCVDHLSRT